MERYPSGQFIYDDSCMPFNLLFILCKKKYVVKQGKQSMVKIKPEDSVIVFLPAEILSHFSCLAPTTDSSGEFFPTIILIHLFTSSKLSLEEKCLNKNLGIVQRTKDD
jgi:hypothetical protein